MKNSFFLENVKLSGYKSILNIDVNFERGLNIIIGKNAAGKTNFLSFLNKSLEFSYDDLLNFSTSLKFKNGKEVLIESCNEIVKDDFIKSNSVTTRDVRNTLKIDGEIIPDNNENRGDLSHKLTLSQFNFTNTFVRHGIPRNFYLIDSPFSYHVDKEGFPSDLIKMVLDPNTPFFIKNLLADFIFSNIRNKKGDLSKLEITKSIKNTFNKINDIRDLVIKYSPIEDIRFNENFNVFLDDDKEKYTINNLFIEFKVQGNWHPFSNLSDGTKRLFYIISEVGFSGKFHFSNRGFGMRSENMTNRIVLIEEPELGIHPHQLMKLMEFLKDESQNKQIIITTHSPQIIDILEETELSKIVIAYMNSSNKGTELRHLDEHEILKALKYLEEDFLSDYWKYSDLEK